MHPATLDALAGVQRIVHAGDVGDPAILARLAAVAPVTAVRGNVDRGELARALPAFEVLEVEGRSLYVCHDVAGLDIDPAAAGFVVVISGHTHVAKAAMTGGVLYLNPGSCGPRRFHLPITLARLTVETGRIVPEIVTLAV